MEIYSIKTSPLKVLTIITMLFALSACGGGGSEPSNPTPTTNENSSSPPPNKAPTISIDGPSEFTENTAITLDAVGSDPDGNIVSYLWSFDSKLPIEAEGLQSPQLTLTSSQLDADISMTLTLTVTDNQGAQASTEKSIKVINKPASPFNIDVTIDNTVIEQKRFQLTLSSNEKQSDISSINWSYESPIDLIVEGLDKSVLSVTSPNILEPMKVTFNLEVTHIDGRVAKHSQTVLIQALENLAPEVIINGENSTIEGTPFSLKAHATDQDGEISSYKWTHNSNIELFLEGESTNTLVVTSTDITVDTLITFTVEVTDNQSAKKSSEFDVLVKALPNIPPSVTVLGANKVTEQNKLLLKSEAIDTDGHIVSTTWAYKSDIKLLEVNISDNEFSFIAPDVQEDQEITIVVTVSDNQNATYSKEHKVTIEALPNASPEVTIQAQDKFIEKQAFTLTGIAKDSDGEIVSFAWSHDANIPLTIDNASSSTISVSSSDIQEAQEVTFTFTATDNQGAQSHVTHFVQIEPIVIDFTLQGKVTDSPIQYAEVTATINGQQFNTTADENGDYSLNIKVDESEASQLIMLKAIGINKQKNVSLASQLNSVDYIQQIAKDDGSITKEELFAVNITNVTTAEYALMQNINQNYLNDEELELARGKVSAQQKINHAILLKAVIDHNITLPNGAETTLALLQNPELTNDFFVMLREQQPTLISQLEREILNDDKLVKRSSFSPSGQYYLTQSEYADGLNIILTFAEDGWGMLNLPKQSVPFDWQQNGNDITVTTSEVLSIEYEHLKHALSFTTRKFIMSVFDNTDTSKGVLIDFELADEMVEFPSGTLSTSGELFSTNAFKAPNLDELYGTWSLTYSRFGLNSNFTIEIKENGIAEVDLGFGALAATWRINSSKLSINVSSSTLNISFIRSFNIGYQVVVGFGVNSEESYRQGIFVKNQNISFDDINYRKTWRRIHTKNSDIIFSINDQDNFNYRWQRNVYAQNNNGVLVRKEYFYKGKSVSFCEVNLADCRIEATNSYHLIAQNDNSIVVSLQRVRNGTSDKSSALQFFELSNLTWNSGRFTNSFFNSVRLHVLNFNGSTNLNGLYEDQPIELYSERYCPTNPSPLSECSDGIVMNNTHYKVTMKNDLLQLENVSTGSLSYLGIMVESDSELAVCHFEESSTCENGEHYTFSL
ncbi:PKD domain-containing protein [Pseudoalteromonas phenolica]|uniref:carboxypeptidase-like regulatory domain-containing protein n=1 Tax=Pseudoalteromonas phenolica TaxID=161398 RepID=UPI00384FDB69